MLMPMVRTASELVLLPTLLALKNDLNMMLASFYGVMFIMESVQLLEMSVEAASLIAGVNKPFVSL